MTRRRGSGIRGVAGRRGRVRSYLARRRARPYTKYAALAHWAKYGLEKPNQWAAAEYGWQAGDVAFARQWCPARNRHWWLPSVYDYQRGKVYTQVCIAIERRREGQLQPARRVRDTERW